MLRKGWKYHLQWSPRHISGGESDRVLKGEVIFFDLCAMIFGDLSFFAMIFCVIFGGMEDSGEFLMEPPLNLDLVVPMNESP